MIDLFNSGAGPFVVPLAVCAAALIAGNLTRPRSYTKTVMDRAWSIRIYEEQVGPFEWHRTLPPKYVPVPPPIHVQFRDKNFAVFTLSSLMSADPPRTVFFVNVFAPIGPNDKPRVETRGYETRDGAILNAAMAAEPRKVAYRLRVKRKRNHAWLDDLPVRERLISPIAGEQPYPWEKLRADQKAPGGPYTDPVAEFQRCLRRHQAQRANDISLSYIDPEEIEAEGLRQRLLRRNRHPSDGRW